MDFSFAFKSFNRDDLLGLVNDFLTFVCQQADEIKTLKAENKELRSQIELLKREHSRQAAPFSNGKHVKNRKRPGRKPGKGVFHYKDISAPDEVTEPPVDVPVTATTCPDCGGPLEEFRFDFAFKTEIPEHPKPQVTQYRVSVCRCTKCGKQVRGQHPDVAPDQYGATAHRMGERVMATAHGLHYEHGVPTRKTPAILKDMTGVVITQSAIMRDALKRAEGELAKPYEQSRESVRQSERVNTDDTGWQIDGETAFLMAFDTDEVTVFQIRDQHRNEEVREVIPSDYQGVMGTDRGPSYDAKELADVKQQKCLSHILNNISDMLETKHGQARKFGVELKIQLQKSLKLWHGYHEKTVKNYEAKAQRLKDRITYHLRIRLMRDPDNQRLLNEIGRHHDAGNLLRFLDDPRIQPTNNRAEQALRSGVIARKVSHCSKNQRGAHAYSVFKTEASKLKKAGKPVIGGFYEVFRSTKLQEASP